MTEKATAAEREADDIAFDNSQRMINAKIYIRELRQVEWKMQMLRDLLWDLADDGKPFPGVGDRALKLNGDIPNITKQLNILINELEIGEESAWLR